MNKEFWSFARDFFGTAQDRPFRPDERSKYSAPAYNGERCRKCGSTSSGMMYVAGEDVLKLICHTCSFSWTRTPLDRVSGNGEGSPDA